MSPIKTNIDNRSAEMFLQKQLGDKIEELEAIEQGEVNRAYFFRHNGQKFVVRFNQSFEGFQRERDLSYRFSSEMLPIPKMVEAGAVNNQIYYAISERAAGKTLQHYEEKQLQHFLPELSELLFQKKPAGDRANNWLRIYWSFWGRNAQKLAAKPSSFFLMKGSRAFGMAGMSCFEAAF